MARAYHMGAKLRLPNPYFCSVWLQKGPSFCRTEALSARNAGFEAIFGQNGIFTREGLKKMDCHQAEFAAIVSL